MPTPHDIAAWLARHAFHVFPLRPKSKRPFGNCPDCKTNRCTPSECTCLEAEQPCHGYLAATTEEPVIRRWWSRAPRANVGIATGPSRLVVLDLDRKDRAPAAAANDVPTPATDGLAALAAIAAAEAAPWPDTLTAATPTDGRHLYFQCPHELEVSSDATGRVGHQIDIRAQGGYVLAPGCVITTPPEEVPDTYTRISVTTTTAPLPEWLQRRVATPQPAPAPPAVHLRAVRTGEHTTTYWQRVWDGELTKVETQEGERWRLLYASARRLANLAIHDSAHWTETTAVDALVTAALRRRQRTGKPLEENTARRNATRGWHRGTHDGPDSLFGRSTAA